MVQKYPLPPFTMETALQKVQLAEDAGIAKTLKEFVWLILSIQNGEIERTLLTEGKS